MCSHRLVIASVKFPSSGGVARSAGVVLGCKPMSAAFNHPAPSGHPSEGGEFDTL
jgi:hypothetical protein